MSMELGDGFGYGYDTLLEDLERWGQSAYATIDSVGASVQNRTIWQLTITNAIENDHPRRTVFIHARTHPIEVQSTWVTNEIINLLLSEGPSIQALRDSVVFYIIPMLNPDGVELGYYRENAHGIDIESNWSIPHLVEPEVAAIRLRLTELMNSEAPIEVALNMHSAYACKRYFVFHDSAGTSLYFTTLEKQFIESVRSYFPAGIEPWNYYVSWRYSTPTRYPESWFWMNYGEAVMALTYEDMNCDTASAFDSTARALIFGVRDFLGLSTLVNIAERDNLPTQYILEQNYPNPFNSSTVLRFSFPESIDANIFIYDIRGRLVNVLRNGPGPAGQRQVRWDGRDTFGRELPSGVYIATLSNSKLHNNVKMVLLR
ncbi:M14 family zinc carboxypeptidase [Candidatus Neomarinimicrobiota bacterium]